MIRWIKKDLLAQLKFYRTCKAHYYSFDVNSSKIKTFWIMGYKTCLLFQRSEINLASDATPIISLTV